MGYIKVSLLTPLNIQTGQLLRSPSSGPNTSL